ncbi:MAG: helix-turn-helix transcriptional regulator, partial [Candidatus Hodarchaeota archaeon]
ICLVNHMSMDPSSWRRLGFLQLSILTLVWKSEMYGLELLNNLKLNGYLIGPGQLYPTLGKLEERRLISSREEIRRGANRKFFQATELGKQLVIYYLMDFLSLFSEMQAEKVSFVTKDIYELIEISPGITFADFSIRRTGRQFVPIIEICKQIGVNGHVFLTSTREDYTNLYKERIKDRGLRNATVLGVERGETTLPDNSVDLAICIFTLYMNDTEWIIPEMGRVLKSNGTGLIVDTKEIEGELDARFSLIDMLLDLVPQLSKIGLNLPEVKNLLTKNGLVIHTKKENRGVIYLILKKQ